MAEQAIDNRPTLVRFQTGVPILNRDMTTSAELEKKTSKHALGCIPQTPDHRDALFSYSVSAVVAKDLPAQIDLPQLPIWDQGDLGSCTGHGINRIVLFDAVKQGLLKASDIPSRLMTYWGERAMEGTINYDAGAQIRDGIKFIAKYGTCLEDGTSSWPYIVSKFKDRPPSKCWKAALQFQALRYMPIRQTTQELRGCLAEGYPIVFGFVVYPEIEDVGSDGILPMPSIDNGPLGGHCVAIVGYNDITRLFKCANSWGEGWGDKGYFYMPYEYMVRTDLSMDFWTIRTVG